MEDVKPHTQISTSTVLKHLENNTTLYILHSCHMEVNLGYLEPEASVERGPQKDEIDYKILKSKAFENAVA
jgi:hypothetical protein